MNAGGAFGQIADVVARVHGVQRDGRLVTLSRHEIDFGYRKSGLNHLLITAAELQLQVAEANALREQLKNVMAYKSRSQPLGDDSAGCCFKNPTLVSDLDGVGTVGARVSAGLLIDRAGLKGLVVGGAKVSDRHGNFLVAAPGGRARDVIQLMALVTQRVNERFGVNLEPEVVVWRRP
jgi:UDP-N-acetylmuramate dehydrogenase